MTGYVLLYLLAIPSVWWFVREDMQHVGTEPGNIAAKALLVAALWPLLSVALTVSFVGALAFNLYESVTGA